jgi:sn-glycerol 3-phosphate transport system substrate-binding protein
MSRLFMALLAWALCSGGALAGSEIRLWHSFAGFRGAAFESLVARFNGTQSAITVVPVYKGSPEAALRGALAARKSRRGPHIVQIGDAATADALAAEGAVRPLWKVMSDAGLALDAKGYGYVPAVASYYSDANGRLLALPLENSTPILYYNRDAFRRARLDPDRPPRTWDDMFPAIEALVAAGARCPFTTASPSWVLVENMSAWHNEEVASLGNGFEGMRPELTLNRGLSMRVVSRLSTWARAGYFSYSGRRAEGVARFAAGECALLTASSASYAELRRSVRFDLGVAQFPYYDDYLAAPQNTLVGGSSLWVAGSTRPREARDAAKFMAFLLRPEVQLEWHQKTGYVPLVAAAYEQSKKEGFYRANPGYEIAIRQLLFRPPTRDTRGIRLAHFDRIRAILDEELEAVWRGQKAPIGALNTAVKRGNAILNGGADVRRGERTAQRRRDSRAAVGQPMLR